MDKRNLLLSTDVYTIQYTKHIIQCTVYTIKFLSLYSDIVKAVE